MTEATAGAFVLFSGGQDSTTCLAWALDRYARVETVGFDYGQRHRVELDQRAEIREGLRNYFPAWHERLGEDHVIRIEALAQISTTAMTHDIEIVADGRGLPNTFVPGRNLIFLTLAAALAYRRGFKHIVGGMCETDFSGYPDCRDDTVKAMQLALNLGMDARFVLETPLMWLDKAATWRLAESSGGDRSRRPHPGGDPQLLSRRARAQARRGAMAAVRVRPASFAPKAGGNTGRRSPCQCHASAPHARPHESDAPARISAFTGNRVEWW